MKLSIIVSVYNLEAYVADCLNSLIGIPLPDNEFEIIVIDDGSTDGSLELLKKYDQKCPHIHLYSQENKGVGAARNLGLKKASGTFVWFVDGDDFINPALVNECLNEAIEQKVDVMAFDFLPVNESGTPEDWITFSLNFTGRQIVSGSQFYLDNFSKSYVWLYFFKRSIFVTNSLVFHDSIKMQDGEIMPRIFFHCTRVGYVKSKILNYRYRKTSAVNDKNEQARYNFYYSMVVVAHRLRIFQGSLNRGELMCKALNLKIKQMNQMLFTNLIGNHYSLQTNLIMIKLLKEYQVLPFQRITGFTMKMNLVYNLIRGIVNVNPLRGRQVFQRFFLR